MQEEFERQTPVKLRLKYSVSRIFHGGACEYVVKGEGGLLAAFDENPDERGGHAIFNKIDQESPQNIFMGRDGFFKWQAGNFRSLRPFRSSFSAFLRNSRDRRKCNSPKVYRNFKALSETSELIRTRRIRVGQISILRKHHGGHAILTTGMVETEQSV
ncbi:hypothetical protein HPB52_008243 [Rhipicephalus sanguineus]|uniref:Uncharacterized protein n=1 Tax=Rhipicephalus sanguineus TaxID=34632 RepID=A0A9D4PCC1_RHISA|nr:hypothetical protein HPB52_008243 [Rhipicephalus sanguineus]